MTPDPNSIDLDSTGERYLPQDTGEIQLEHLHRYAAARALASGKRVIDVACGEGYGSKYLGEVAMSVLGVDVDLHAVEHAKSLYTTENVSFSVGDAAGIPAPDNSADLVVSFETIEHISNPWDLVQEAKRVLNESGLFIVSTPNPIEYTILPGYSNPFHINELRLGKFVELLEESFENVHIYGQRCSLVSLLFDFDAQEDGVLGTYADRSGASNPLASSRPVYFVALASNNPLPRLEDSVFSLSPENTSSLNSNGGPLPQLFKTLWTPAKSDELRRETGGKVSRQTVSRVESASIDELIAELMSQRRISDDLKERVDELLATNSLLYSEIEIRGQALEDRKAEAEKLSRLVSDLQTDIDMRGRQGQEDLKAEAEGLAAPSSELPSKGRQTISELVVPNGSITMGASDHDGADEISVQVDHELISQYDSLKIQYDALLHSTSWRVTLPLRNVSQGIRNSAPGRIATRGANVIRKYFRAESMVKNTFDRKFYLESNPDVAASGADPFEHYLLHGSKEGRVGMPIVASNQTKSEFQPSFAAGKCKYRSELPDLLLIVHEGTITGAPVLGLAILKEIVKFFNVYVIFLNPGPLEGEYLKMSVSVATLSDRKGIGQVFTDEVTKGVTRFPRTFGAVIANTVISGCELNHLQGVVTSDATISLIHEFPTQETLGFFDDTVYASDIVVYSSELVRDKTVEMLESYGVRNSVILPQGKILYDELYSASSLKRDSISGFRSGDLDISASWLKGKYVVGCGTVDFRKGVDLFVSVAAQILRNDPDSGLQFVWLGSPIEQTRTYATMVEQQVKNSGVEANIHFVDFMENPDSLFANAAAMLVTSRLDPLPNVALDAIYYGTPVVCFEQAGGLPGFFRQLAQDVGHEVGVAVPYSDVESMAEATIAIVNSARSETSEISDKSDRGNVQETMSMESYVRRLREILGLAKERHANVKSIIESSAGKGDDYSGAFIRSWASGSLRKMKSESGFHPGIASEESGFVLEPIETIYEIANGTSDTVNHDSISIREFTKPSSVPSARTAIHVHAFYTQLVEDIFQRISKNDMKPDLFVTVSSEDDRSKVAEVAKRARLEPLEIIISPNSGRNFGPFLNLSDTLSKDYSIVGHIHTKFSSHVSERDFVTKWREFMLENTIGGRYPAMDMIIDQMVSQDSIAVSYPDDPHVIGWTKNRMFGEDLLRRASWNGNFPHYFNFPVGSMFWATSEVMQIIEGLKITPSDLPFEPLPIDGTIIHALERVIGVIPQMLGKKALLVRLPGTSRH